jgi:large subunit ribosomal protein L30
MKRIAAVRVRGSAGVPQDIKYTLECLRLSRVNYCVIVDDRPSYMGMLNKAKDYITWGPLDKDTLVRILTNRGELVGGKKLTDEYIRKNTAFKSISDFAEAFMKFKAELKDIPGLRPFFRLHPPRKGYGGIKRSYTEGGALGPRDEIKSLLYRMR